MKCKLIQNPKLILVESRMFNSLLLQMLPLENTSISYILLQLLYVYQGINTHTSFAKGTRKGFQPCSTLLLFSGDQVIVEVFVARKAQMEAKIGSQFPPILPSSRSHVLPRDMAPPATMFGIVWAGLFNSSFIKWMHESFIFTIQGGF